MTRISSGSSYVPPLSKPPVAPIVPIVDSAKPENRELTDSERQIAANQARVEAGMRNLGVMMSIQPADDSSSKS